MERLRDRTASTWRALAELPVVRRYALLGGVVAGVLGGVAGLIIGLRVYPPTAWFAIIEVGLPAAVVGALLGLLLGAVARETSRRRVGYSSPER
ncbi:MAG TPA: hypothetical protein VGK35_12960 [Actinotalea sp.]|jgi:membrane associated rhomboid family serine protease